MELNELIAKTLRELEKTRKRHPEKSKYLVEEINLEINISSIETTDGKLSLMIFNGGMTGSTQQSHKISLKLKPNPNKL